jgi:hypothetical protein
MEEDIGLVVLEHLGNELNVHVLDVDLLFGCQSTKSETTCSLNILSMKYLKALVHDHHSFVELLLYLESACL